MPLTNWTIIRVGVGATKKFERVNVRVAVHYDKPHEACGSSNVWEHD